MRVSDQQLKYISKNFDQRLELCDGRIIFDSYNSLGATAYNKNVRYLGFAALMLPDVFLSLAAPFNATSSPQKSNSLSYLKEHANDPGWAPPMLNISREEKRVVGHEGRHRMTVARELCNDPIIVHMFLKGERAHNITPDIIDKLRDGLFRERNHSQEPHRFVFGPLFNYAFIQDIVQTW